MISESRFRSAVLALLGLCAAALWWPNLPSARADESLPPSALSPRLVASTGYSFPPRYGQ